ncbi:MAG: C4-dicarboxylate ABC transporter [Rhodobacterales bacterium]|nr:MAG: C4-dicarboxylate ABC transporter [Rhodobacterales bacterium]
MTNRRTILGLAAGVALGALTAGAGFAEPEVTLKMHQFLPPQANVPKHILDVWADEVEDASDGRIEIERYHGMALGGKPPELMDQAIDGIADIVWTVNGYTPGRFPTTEVFELPFMVADARAGSYALWKMFEKHMKDTEFKDVHILATHVHGPGMFHTADPVETPDDLKGMQIRGGSRMVNQLLELVGATPVGMAVPAIPESLSKGVIDGTTIPWEVTGALKIAELVGNHTEFKGPALYTMSFVLAMNKDAYEAMPEDLRKILDEHSGLEASVFFGGTQQDYDAPAREAALEFGNNIITVSEEDAAAWQELVNPIYESWIAEMDAKGIDGQALIDEARALMAEYEANK